MKKQLFSFMMLMLAFSFTMTSQTADSKFGIMISGGKMEYSGDIGSNLLFGTPFQGHVGGRLGYYLSPSFDVFLAGSSGRHGIDETVDNTQFHEFLSDVFQANLGLHWKFLKGEKFNPFLSGAVGFINYSNVLGDGSQPGTNDARGEDASGLHIPLGIGLRYNFTDNFGLFWHSQYGIGFDDQYDGIYEDAPNVVNGNFPANEVTDGNDNYLLHELGLAFSLGKQDADGDGVADKKDACPDTPGLKEYAGCPDSDGDTIIDKDDACPQVAGAAEFNGCPDSDGDKIIDKEDACPEVAGEARYNGCPDSDGDGIGDNVDKCPQESGVSKYDGCPIPDSDGDGFDDDNDPCPNTPGTVGGCPDTDGDGVIDKDDACPDVAGTVMGCPDGDGDGIADKDDKCPTEAGVPEKDGCPAVRKPTRAETINRYCAAPISFGSGSSQSESYDQSISDIAAFARQYPEAFFNVSGYTDSQGAEAANLRLSKRRAKKVADSLVAAGISMDRITHEGYGETNPVADNLTKEGRELNRRVQVCASTTKRVIVNDTSTKR
jgi:outer membrane protein OmpA-like peptidoglycan-associated protein